MKSWPPPILPRRACQSVFSKSDIGMVQYPYEVRSRSAGSSGSSLGLCHCHKLVQIPEISSLSFDLELLHAHDQISRLLLLSEQALLDDFAFCLNGGKFDENGIRQRYLLTESNRVVLIVAEHQRCIGAPESLESLIVFSILSLQIDQLRFLFFQVHYLGLREFHEPIGVDPIIRVRGVKRSRSKCQNLSLPCGLVKGLPDADEVVS